MPYEKLFVSLGPIGSFGPFGSFRARFYVEEHDVLVVGGRHVRDGRDGGGALRAGGPGGARGPHVGTVHHAQRRQRLAPAGARRRHLLDTGLLYIR